MTRTEKALAASILLLLIVVSVVGVFAMKQMNAMSGAQAFADALRADAKQREKETKDRLDKLDDAIRGVKDAKQAREVIEVHVPQTKGESAQVTREQLPVQAQKELPQSPSYTVRTEAGEIAIAKAELACEKDRVKLGECSANLKDKTAEAQRWENTAKGGSASRRAFRIGVLGLCGGGGAAAGASAGKGKGAAIGALAAVVGCALLTK